MRKSDKSISKKKIRLFGKAINSENFASIVIILIITILLTIWSIYRNDKLQNGKTETVTAKIVWIGTLNASGSHFNPYPAIECEYYINLKKHTNYFNSQKLGDDIKVGDCVEIIVNKENNKIYELNYKHGVFNCGQ